MSTCWQYHALRGWAKNRLSIRLKVFGHVFTPEDIPNSHRILSRCIHFHSFLCTDFIALSNTDWPVLFEFKSSVRRRIFGQSLSVWHYVRSCDIYLCRSCHPSPYNSYGGIVELMKSFLLFYSLLPSFSVLDREDKTRLIKFE